MSINTPLADTLSGFLEALLAGRSAINRWRFFDTKGVYSKVGADLSGYDVKAKLKAIESQLEPDMYRRIRRLLSRAPFSTQLSLLLTALAWKDAGMTAGAIDPGKSV